MCGQDSLDFSSLIHSTNQYTNQLLFYRPYTQSAMIRDVDSFTLSLSESNVFQKSDNLEADFEITTLDMSYYYRYNSNIELSFNYPFYYISKGFLDDFLDEVHSTLHIATTREHEGHINNRLRYRLLDNINKNSSYYITGNSQIELKYNLYRKDNLYLSTNIGIKIPMGNVEDGFTTSKIDYMSGVQLQKNYNDFLIVSNAVVTLNTNYRLSSDIISQKYRYFISLGTEFKLIESIDFLFIYQYGSSPYKSSDEKFDSYTHLLQFALRKDLKENQYIDIFFNQNTIPRNNEADVTFGLSYHCKGL